MKVIEALSSFDARKWRRCKVYIRQQYQLGTKERDFFEYVHARKNDLYQRALLRANLEINFYPKADALAFSNLTSRLLKTIETFIVMEEYNLKDNLAQRELLLAKYYKRNGQNKLFKSNAINLLDRLRSASDYSHTKELMLYLTEFELAYSESSPNERIPFLISSLTHLQNFTGDMQVLFETELKNNERANVGASLRDKALGNEKRILRDHLLVMQKLVQDQEEGAYAYIKSTLFEKHAIMSREIAQISLLYLIRHCGYKMRNGSNPARYERMSLFMKGLDTGLLLTNGVLAEARFLNIIESLAFLKSEDDHIMFINEWLPKTETRNTDNLRNISMAYIHFGREEYSNSKDYLDRFIGEAGNMQLILRFRWLKICCIYSLTEHHGHYKSVLKTEERFFIRKRTKLQESEYEGSLNLLRVIKMLWENEAKEYIRKKTSDYKYLIFRHWIEKQLEK